MVVNQTLLTDLHSSLGIGRRSLSLGLLNRTFLTNEQYLQKFVKLWVFIANHCTVHAHVHVDGTEFKSKFYSRKASLNKCTPGKKSVDTCICTVWKSASTIINVLQTQLLCLGTTCPPGKNASGLYNTCVTHHSTLYTASTTMILLVVRNYWERVLYYINAHYSAENGTLRGREWNGRTHTYSTRTFMRSSTFFSWSLMGPWASYR